MAEGNTVGREGGRGRERGEGGRAGGQEREREGGSVELSQLCTAFFQQSVTLEETHECFS